MAKFRFRMLPKKYKKNNKHTSSAVVRERSILAEGTIAPSVALSGGALFDDRFQNDAINIGLISIPERCKVMLSIQT